ncbi:carbonate dehydratase [Aquisalimonas sp. 2447]|nr:carbonate dehydratase [Aquisalimonas sp. 2447]QIT54718.1 carbonate dehydratase [Aquisalimonas sp. 2447]
MCSHADDHGPPPEVLLEANRAWAERMQAEDPEYFRRQAEGQAPRYLWIGCADSRVPATQMVDLGPGEMFVHRNIANVVSGTDLNCMAVLQYAVDVLQVRDVIVCGHYGCGGVKAALGDQQHGRIDAWLGQIKDVWQHNREAVEAMEGEARVDRLCELNVVAQVYNTALTTIVQNAWARGQALAVHGWIYRLANGRLSDLGVTLTGAEQLSAVYRMQHP